MVTNIFGYVIDLDAVAAITPLECDYYNEQCHFYFSIIFKSGKDKIKIETDIDPSSEKEKFIKEWQESRFKEHF